MRKTKSFLFALLFLMSFSACSNKTTGQTVTLTESGQSDYSILIAGKQNQYEQKAAVELQKYIKLISGVEIPISQNSEIKGNKIILSSDRQLIERFSEKSVAIEQLGIDGYHIKTVGQNLVLAGGTGKGVLYVVYSFLEDYLGCRYYNPDVFVIPESKQIRLTKIDKRFIPILTNRIALFKQSLNEQYRNWHKLDLYRDTEDGLWGSWAHSFMELVPPTQYLKSHPEYYALTEGKRQATQLCLSNPEVVKIATENLAKKIQQNPKAKYWSVAQEDNNKKCECDQCKALDLREGSPSGSIINFVNKIAAKFPDKVITTLAYTYSQKPPKTIKPASNVLVIFCTTGNFDRGKRYTGQQGASSYTQHLAAWGNISKQLMVWDYVVDYKHFLLPVPNLQAVSTNLNDFVKNHATGIFWQGNIYGGGAFDELKSYLLAKLSWDPTLNSNDVIEDFLKGYYGNAASKVSTLLKEMTNAYAASGKELGLFDNPSDHIQGYLSLVNLDKYFTLLNEAAKAVEGQPILVDRVNSLRAGFDYAYLENSFFDLPGLKNEIATKVGLVNKVKVSSGSAVVNKLANVGKSVLRSGVMSSGGRSKDLSQLNNIMRALQSQKIAYMNEAGLTPQQYDDRMRPVLNDPNTILATDNLAIGKKITLLNKPTDVHAKYAGNDALIDGIRGSIRLELDTWQGFYGGSFGAIVDLGASTDVRSIVVGFLKRPHVGIEYPTNFQVSYSNDGTNFKELGASRAEVVDTLPKSAKQDYSVSSNVKCRYIKVTAKQSAKAAMFLDEIIIK
ncbi:DUF4838 domain-containing protein [Olivibacter sp. CPCC 100613]|uniref:DUF4838 domain-containing protein n=1 Tax=Olivibacter sp. CPCC 100613 TaxID=3079931 RepID=UPI002FFBDC6D